MYCWRVEEVNNWWILDIYMHVCISMIMLSSILLKNKFSFQSVAFLLFPPALSLSFSLSSPFFHIGKVSFMLCIHSRDYVS